MNPAKSYEPRRITAVQAARLLNLSPAMVRRLAVTMRVGVQIGNLWTFAASEVEVMRGRKRKPGRPRKEKQD